MYSTPWSRPYLGWIVSCSQRTKSRTRSAEPSSLPAGRVPDRASGGSGRGRARGRAARPRRSAGGPWAVASKSDWGTVRISGALARPRLTASSSHGQRRRPGRAAAGPGAIRPPDAARTAAPWSRRHPDVGAGAGRVERAEDRRRVGPPRASPPIRPRNAKAAARMRQASPADATIEAGPSRLDRPPTDPVPAEPGQARHGQGGEAQELAGEAELWNPGRSAAIRQ